MPSKLEETLTFFLGRRSFSHLPAFLRLRSEILRFAHQSVSAKRRPRSFSALEAPVDVRVGLTRYEPNPLI